MQTASAGKSRSRGDRELTDISEVIRAAESGDIQADYVLQINIFDTELNNKIEIDLRHAKEIRQFLRENPEVKAEFEGGHHMLHCAVIESKMNA